MSIKNSGAKPLLFKLHKPETRCHIKLHFKQHREHSTSTINQTLNLEKFMSTPSNIFDAFSSTSIPRCAMRTPPNSLAQIEASLKKSDGLPAEDRFSAVQIAISDLIALNPELSNLLTKIKMTLNSCFEDIKYKQQELEKKSAEDLKKVMKRYKSSAIENLELQAKVKKYREIKNELKKDKKRHEELIKEKDKEIELYKGPIENTEKKRETSNFSLLDPNDRRYRKELAVDIPRKTFRIGVIFDASPLSSIVAGHEINHSPSCANDMDFSPLLLTVS